MLNLRRRIYFLNRTYICANISGGHICYRFRCLFQCIAVAHKKTSIPSRVPFEFYILVLNLKCDDLHEKRKHLFSRLIGITRDDFVWSLD